MIRALLDANVIYPAPLRDLLFSIAAEEVFQPLWTKQINDLKQFPARTNAPKI
jgi:hypothetical protein